MTIDDLYNWAVLNNVEYYDIKIQYRDGGGSYNGHESLYVEDIEVDKLRREVIL